MKTIHRYENKHTRKSCEVIGNTALQDIQYGKTGMYVVEESPRGWQTLTSETYLNERLIEGIIQRDPHIVKTCIDNNANPDSTDRIGRSALIWAAYFSDYSITESLLLAGAHPDLKTPQGMTPLMEAACFGKDTNVLKLLIDLGANLDEIDSKGRTALILAAYLGNTAKVEILLNHGADHKKVDEKGKTAFDYAVGKGHADILELLS